MLWAAKWVSENSLDGRREWLIHEALVVALFPTRRACREYIKKHFGYIADRPDLRAEPHGWRVPQPTQVDVSLPAAAPRVQRPGELFTTLRGAQP
jgi:hypothetical protein